MRLSIVIPVYGPVDRLARAVRSAREAAGPEAEILVVDDGSPDGGTAARHAASSADARAVVLHHPGKAHRGVSAARNLGIRQASGELLAFLDGDDFYYPNRFEGARRMLEREAAVDAVYGPTRVLFETETAAGAWTSESSWFGIREDVPPDDLLDVLLRDRSWHVSAITARRDFVQRCGLFDEALAIAEDCNLWFRMACLGTVRGDGMRDAVSAYCRHDTNTFRADPARKVDMVTAMARAFCWCRRHGAAPGRLRAFRAGLHRYVLNTVIVLREAGRPDLARRVVLRAAPVLWARWARSADMLRQLKALALGSRQTA